MKIRIVGWFKNISIKNKLYLITGVMLCLITLELVTLYSMVYILSATRGYVGGEGLWSKAQKDATFSLLKYANSHNEQDYQKFLSFINVTLGDRKAREELIKPHPNLQIAYQGFLEGLNQPADIPAMINLFRWFQNTYYLRAAGRIWTTADVVYINKLITISTDLHQKIISNTLTPAEYNQYIDQIYQINSQLTTLATDFSYALGAASRWVEHTVLRAILSIAIIVEFSGLLLMVLVTFNIRKGIDEIIRVSKKVMQLDFSNRASIYSNDEIGQLASSFNQMIDDLETSIIRQRKEISDRKKQEKHLSVRYAITRVIVENYTLETAIPKILKIMCNTMNLQYGGFWKIDSINNIMYCVEVWAVNDNKVRKFAESSKKISLTSVSLPGRVWKSKATCWIQDLAKDANFSRLNWAEKAGFRSAFAIPILFEGEVQGVLEFFTHRYYSIDDYLLFMLNDISNLLGIFSQREHAQKSAAALSRLTGMAEVASNVLHNVGNTLNTINTSIILMSEKIAHSKVSAIDELDTMLQQHKDDINNFLVHDEKGRHIPQFISLLAKEWFNENQYFASEIDSLIKNVSHVKKVIMMQQSLSHIIGETEEIKLIELLEEVILFNKIVYERAAITIMREFSPVKPIITNSEKLFQIIMNLVKNGIDALIESKHNNKQLILRLQEQDDSHFMIQIIDNGVGIPSENIAKIFSHGFSTKQTGHGFGLHACMLYAEELGGNLFAESRGVDQGATFTLIMPYQFISKKEVNYGFN